jgi:hypothetical protein
LFGLLAGFRSGIKPLLTVPGQFPVYAAEVFPFRVNADALGRAAALTFQSRETAKNLKTF